MNLAGKPTYRFEDIELDASQGCLKRSGQEQHLRLQTFQVLLYLIEQRERLVTKEELIQNIWQQTAVTDNTLVQCIVDIRKALGDDPRQPRFIKTIPKVGYRFIGPVEERHSNDPSAVQPAELVAAEIKPAEKTEPLAVSGQVRVPASAARTDWLRRNLTAISLIAVVFVCAVALVALLGYLGRQRAEITLPQVPGKKPVAVMFFENQSASQDLDWLREGLADMLITDLARSNKLIVLSRQQLYLLLERRSYQPAERIRFNEALDIARRSHAEAFVLGSFAALDEQVRIDVRLHETQSGQLLAAERLLVDSLSQILMQVDLLSLKLAAHLGVAPLDRDRHTSLAEVMTDNLEAYRYYSLGVQKAHAFENARAIELLQKAIELDPKFGMAYARIGYAYAVTDFLPEKGRPYLEKAFQLSDRLTEKDKLYITAWYAIARGDYASAIQTFRQMITHYPFEVEAYRQLARLLYGEEQTDEAINVLRQGLTIDPEAKELYNGLGMFNLGLGRYDEAIAAHYRYLELAPQEPNAHDSLGMSFQQSGRFDEAIVEYNSALALNPEFEPAIIHLGDVYFQQGRYREAIRQYERYIQVTGSDLARALGYSNIAYVHWRKGDRVRAEQAARHEMRLEKRAVWNSLILALERGEQGRTEKLKEKLFERLPYPQRGARHDLRSFDYFRGTLALKSGRVDEAIEHYKEALRHLPPTSGIDLYEDCLANAYLSLGRLDDAINEYQRILSRNPNYPLVHYHLGQAFERRGERERARAAYERFLQIWKHADQDIPEVVDAKQRLGFKR